MEQARDAVIGSEYQFKKGSSRSKKLRNLESENSDERGKMKRPKITSESRKKRIEALEADIRRKS